MIRLYENDFASTKKFLLYVDDNVDDTFIKDDNYISSIHRLILGGYRLARNVQLQYF